MRRSILPTASTAAVLALGGVALARAQSPPSLNDLVGRMGAYVEGYGERASIIVGVERYSQNVVRTLIARAGAAPLREHRQSVGEFAIVKPTATSGWIGFRDVIEVDGQRIVEHQDRLLNILMDTSQGLDEARRLLDESARLNIGGVTRNFNVPTTALFLFTPANRDRFKFSHRRTTDGAWEIGFREVGRPTVIRTPAGQSVPCEGRLWVQPSNGTIVRTQLYLNGLSPGGSHASADIEVRYRLVDGPDMWLPETMTEIYEGTWPVKRERIVCHAAYSHYRTFQTSARIK